MAAEAIYLPPRGNVWPRVCKCMAAKTAINCWSGDSHNTATIQPQYSHRELGHNTATIQPQYSHRELGRLGVKGNNVLGPPGAAWGRLRPPGGERQ